MNEIISQSLASRTGGDSDNEIDNQSSSSSDSEDVTASLSRASARKRAIFGGATTNSTPSVVQVDACSEGGTTATTTPGKPKSRKKKRNAADRSDASSRDLPSLNRSELVLFGIKVERQRQMVRLAGWHYEARYLWLSFAPAMALTLLAGILAFVDRAAAAGVVAGLAVVLQGTSKLSNCSILAERCHAAAEALQRVMEDLDALLATAAPTCSQDALDERQRALETRFQLARTKDCSLPSKIQSAFESLTIKLENQHRLDGTEVRLHQYMTAYQQLFMEISKARLFPILVPSATESVDFAMDSLGMSPAVLAAKRRDGRDEELGDIRSLGDSTDASPEQRVTHIQRSLLPPIRSNASDISSIYTSPTAQ